MLHYQKYGYIIACPASFISRNRLEHHFCASHRPDHLIDTGKIGIPIYSVISRFPYSTLTQKRCGEIYYLLDIYPPLYPTNVMAPMLLRWSEALQAKSERSRDCDIIPGWRNGLKHAEFPGFEARTVRSPG